MVDCRFLWGKWLCDAAVRAVASGLRLHGQDRQRHMQGRSTRTQVPGRSCSAQKRSVVRRRAGNGHKAAAAAHFSATSARAKGLRSRVGIVFQFSCVNTRTACSQRCPSLHRQKVGKKLAEDKVNCQQGSRGLQSSKQSATGVGAARRALLGSECTVSPETDPDSRGPGNVWRLIPGAAAL